MLLEMSDQTYVFAEGTNEEQRLTDQATVLDPLTARLFARAGLAPGMRVLDLGSGAGNVAELAAEAVGRRGSVLGVDRDPDAVRSARRRLAGKPNVEFREGDLCDLSGVAGEFDAVVGRAVLMYLSEPAAALREAVRHVRPGGLVCMHEGDMTYGWASHATPLWKQVRGWLMDTFTRAGANLTMGAELFGAFRAAGLPDPELALEAPVGGGARSPAFGWANSLEAVLPLLERFEIATAETIGVDTLTERLNAEIDAQDGFVLGPLMYGGWCTLPAA